MKDLIVKIISEIQEENRIKNIVPDHALWSQVRNELLKDIKTILNELISEGKLELGNTINDKYLKLKNHGKTKN